MLKLYAERSHYAKEYRAYLMPLLRPFWKDEPFTDIEREQIYGSFVRNIKLVEQPTEADICVLPMSWLYYYRTRSLPQAVGFVDMARAAGKAVVSWQGGDFTVPVPVQGVYVFSANGYQSRRRPLQFALPSFFRDPLIELGQTDIIIRSRQDRPVIGFCGQANDSLAQKIGKPIATLWKNLKFHSGFSYFEPHTLFPPTYLRARTLAILENSPQLITKFIKRNRYRGGTEKPQDILRHEFLYNIQQTDYTVCVRGTANYSQRFYETLALGRIPIFINTDCILPYDHRIVWPDYCVWVEQKELAELPQKVAHFHNNLDETTFQTWQRRCRQLWEERLCLAGFHTHFAEHFAF